MKAEPSRSARRAARHRAVHQLIEGGAVFFDPLAVDLLGQDPRQILREPLERPDERLTRLFVAARSRFAEDCMAAAVERGVRQTVVLGAGLDTFGLRNPHAAKNLRVFEADRPNTQRWKRELIAAAGLSVPETLHFVAVDFEQQSVTPALAAAGFRDDEPAFFMWLGVVPYLTRTAISGILTTIAGIPSSEVTFDYGEPLETFPETSRLWLDRRMAHVAAQGEPWLSFFDPAELRGELLARGFADIEDLGLGRIAARYFGGSAMPLEFGGAHVVHARRVE